MKKIISAVFLLFALMAPANEASAQCSIPKDVFDGPSGVSIIYQVKFTKRESLILNNPYYVVSFLYQSSYGNALSATIEVDNLKNKDEVPEIGDRVMFLPAHWLHRFEREHDYGSYFQKKRNCKLTPFGNEYMNSWDIEQLLSGPGIQPPQRSW